MKLFFLILTLGIFCATKAQDSIHAFELETIIPKWCLGEKIYIAKYDLLTPVEANRNIEDSYFLTREEAIENVNEYNLVEYRLLNNYIQDQAEKYLDSNLRIIHKRDIDEDTSIRFVIYPMKTKYDLVQDDFLFRFHIFDRQTNTKYANIKISILLDLLTQCSDKYLGLDSNLIDQNEMDVYANSLFPKPKKEIPKGLKWTGGFLLYLVFQGGVILLANIL